MFQSLIEYDVFQTASIFLSTVVAETENNVEPGLIAPEQMAGYVVTGLFTAVNIFVMFLILRRFVFKPILRILEKRRVSVEEEIISAHDNRIKTEEMLAESKHTVDHARTEASSIIEEAKIQAEKQADNIIKQAKTEAKEIVLKAHEDTRRIHSLMLEEMKDDVADLAVLIASRALGRALDEDEQKILNDMIVDETDQTEVITRDKS